MRRLYLKAVLMLLSLVAAVQCQAIQAQGIDVWVDFTSDFHDGNGGASNGVADWIDELNEATRRSGGVTDGPPSQNQFTVADRQEIQSNIVSELEAIYAGYNLNFVTSQPAGVHDVIYFGGDDDLPEISNSTFGRASSDLGNLQTRTYTTTNNGNPPGVSTIFTGNFSSSLEPRFNTREESIEEISVALGGTAAHEFGHSFGLFHQYAYSAIGISDLTNSGGLQNQHLMATGSTGLNEAQRETRRTLAPFSRVILDIAGGSTTYGGAALVDNPVISTFEGGPGAGADGGDAGGSFGTATDLVFSIGESSGDEISFIEGDLDSTTDVDVFKFSTTVETTLSAHVFTAPRIPGFAIFDSVLELVDGSGTVIALSDDIAWNGNNFGDPPNALDRDTGSFLVNVTVDPGEYFLRVSIATEDFVSFPDVGDGYWLVTSLDRVFTEEMTALKGDVDMNGVVDFADIPPFIAILQSGVFQAEADCDCSTVVDFVDIPAFIGILIAAAS